MASRSLNRVVLIGNLTRDPELKYTPAGVAVCTFGVATNRNWTTANGETKEETQYHRIVAWQKLAELCAKLLTKGRKVYLEGRITYRSFTGRDNQQHQITEIVLDDFIVFNDGRKNNVASEELDKQKTTTEKDQPPPVEDISTEELPATEMGETDVEPPLPETKKNEESVNPDDIPF
jgi:single-strand DNA-binding protein